MPKMIENAPDLEINKVLYLSKGKTIPPHVVREQRIVWNLLKHLNSRQFRFVAVDDGDGMTTLSRDPKRAMLEAMELIFNLDEAYLYVRSSAASSQTTPYYIFLVLGNDLDVVSDWSFDSKAKDGFNAAMESFDAEEFA